VTEDSKSQKLPASDPEKKPVNPDVLDDKSGLGHLGNAEPHPKQHERASLQPGGTSGVWGWPQRAWSFVRDVVRSLSPARFSFFVVLAGDKSSGASLTQKVQVRFLHGARYWLNPRTSAQSASCGPSQRRGLLLSNRAPLAPACIHLD
jgi:hypothetical protein